MLAKFPVAREATNTIQKLLEVVATKVLADQSCPTRDSSMSTMSLIRTHPKNRENLDDKFFELCNDWATYKDECGLDETEFNSIVDGVPKSNYNDKWMEDLKQNYFDLIEKSEEILLASSKNVPVSHSEQKILKEANFSEVQESKLREAYSCQLEALTDSITISIDKLAVEVSKMCDGAESPAQVKNFKSDLYEIDKKMDENLSYVYNQYMAVLPDHEAVEKGDVRKAFLAKEKGRIADLQLMLSKKAKDVNGGTTSIRDSLPINKEQTYLKKVDPPSFKGDPIDFADFMRKWKSQVSTANLPAESELDRLRDNVPLQATKALYGESSMEKAWKILENLYGDKDLIINKLKNQLKSIKSQNKQDHDIVIDLVTDVNNIVLRLSSLGAEQMLHYDNEFLSSVYRVLPSHYQTRWLEYNKSPYKSKWAAFMVFLESSHDQALQNKVLLECYSKEDTEKDLCRKCGISSHKSNNCPSIKAVVGSTDASAGNKKKDDEFKRAKADCGRCPLCNEFHTFYKTREKIEWPSDRLFKCESFRNLSLWDRANTIERLKCCASCTSWNHQEASCPSPAKCGKFVNGVKCDKDHSSLGCGSGNAYCGSAQPIVHIENSKSLSVSANSYSHFPDLCAETLLLFQEVAVNQKHIKAVVCWDKGSTRCLVTHRFAKLHGLKAQEIVFRLSVVGQTGKAQSGCFYEFEILRNDGSSRKIWAFGIEQIMEPRDNIDLSLISHLFPHLPQSTFSSFASDEVDILMGNNFLGEHPSGILYISRSKI